MKKNNNPTNKELLKEIKKLQRQVEENRSRVPYVPVPYTITHGCSCHSCCGHQHYHPAPINPYVSPYTYIGSGGNVLGRGDIVLCQNTTTGLTGTLMNNTINA